MPHRLGLPSPADPWERWKIVGDLLPFMRNLNPKHKWVDDPHTEMAAMYERHLRHILTHYGKRGEGEFIRQTLTITPRFSFKTEMLAEAIVWMLTIAPNLRLLLVSRREDLALKILGAIKRTFESNKWYISEYGEQKPDLKDSDMRLAWAATGIIIASRTEHELRERSVEVASILSLDPGAHFDGGFFDDIHGDDTAEQIDAAWNALQNYIPISNPWGVLAVTMTVWADEDVPMRIERDWSEDLTERLFRPAIDPDWTTCLLPDLYTLEQLLKLRRQMGSYKANCQFALQRIGNDERKFNPNFYKEAEIAGHEARVIAITVDPAYYADSGSSDHAIVVAYWLGGPYIHFRDAVAGKWEEDELFERIMDKVRLYSPMPSWAGVRFLLGLPKDAVEQWMKNGIERRIAKLPPIIRRPQVIPIKGASQTAKIERIRWLVDPYKDGFVTFAQGIEHKEEMQRQLWGFPRASKRDLPDCMAYQFAMMRDQIPADTQPLPDKALEAVERMQEWYEMVLQGRSGELVPDKDDWRGL